MTAATRQSALATGFYRFALAVAFLLSAVLFSAIIGFGIVDVSSPWTLWGVVLLVNPFVALALRNVYRAQFDKPGNLMALAVVVIGLVALHFGLMLYLNP